MSPVDIATGHVRRYTKKSMRAALTEAGPTVEKVKYVNALGLLGYYMATSVFKLVPKEGPMVKFYDRFVLPVTKAAEKLVPMPFGQSVFAVASERTRTDAPSHCGSRAGSAPPAWARTTPVSW